MRITHSWSCYEICRKLTTLFFSINVGSFFIIYENFYVNQIVYLRIFHNVFFSTCHRGKTRNLSLEITNKNEFEKKLHLVSAQLIKISLKGFVGMLSISIESPRRFHSKWTRRRWSQSGSHRFNCNCIFNFPSRRNRAERLWRTQSFTSRPINALPGSAGARARPAIDRLRLPLHLLSLNGRLLNNRNTCSCCSCCCRRFWSCPAHGERSAVWFRRRCHEIFHTNLDIFDCSFVAVRSGCVGYCLKSPVWQEYFVLTDNFLAVTAFCFRLSNASLVDSRFSFDGIWILERIALFQSPKSN